MEGRSLKSRCQQVWFFLRAVRGESLQALLGLQISFSPYLFTSSFLYECVSMSKFPFCIRIPVILVQGPHSDLFLANGIYNDSIFKCHILGYSVLGFQYNEFWRRCNSTHNSTIQRGSLASMAHRDLEMSLQGFCTMTV